MSENNLPATKPDPEAMPGEFDFAKPVAENPRVKRRLLKTSPASLAPASGAPAAARELEREAPPRSTAEAKPEFTPAPDPDNDVEMNDAPPLTGPSPTAARISSTTRPSRPTSPSHPTTSPHGTRPATLYYSQHKDKEETSPMKSTPTASPASSTTTAPSTSPARSATPALRPATVADFRTNVERQTREQKSVGGVLSILVYTLIGFFVLGAALAGYGAYVVHQALHDQSVTVSQLEARYDGENKDLNAKLASTLDTLTQAQAQIGRQQELILDQQKAINKLLSVTQDNAAAVKQERQTRAEETASLRARLKDVEYKGPSTQKY